VSNLKKIHVVFLSLFLVVFTGLSTYFVTAALMKNESLKADQEALDAIGKIVEETTSPVNVEQEYKEIEELKNYVLKNYYLDVTEEQLYEGMKKGIFEVLKDPYSVFMNEDEFGDYMQSSSGEYPGIGIYLTPNNENQIEIVSPIEDTPAFRAGLLAKDLIIGVNGEEVNADVMDEAISKIKGEPGTPVTLTIYRPETKSRFDVDIVREWIDIKVVKSRMIEDKVGYLRLTTFDENSAAEFDKNIKELIKQGAKGIVIDLRNNPGGYLDQCVNIADTLLGKEMIVYTESRNGDDDEFYSDADFYDVELVVLVDGGSASASEILTGALKDHKRATIIGETTFGKGVVQIVERYAENTGFKLTTSQYFTPNGVNIHGIGITPDIEVVLDENYGKIENPTDKDDNQLQKALEVIRTKIKK